jgi:hypothetical protein
VAEVNAIETHKAVTEARQTIIEILSDQYANTLDSNWSRDGDNVTSDGIYLPDIDEIYRQTSPDLQDAKDAGHVVAYVGRTGPSRLAEEYNRATSSWVGEVRTPMGVMIIFSSAPQTAPTDSITGQTYRTKEILEARAERYAGSLRHVISEYAHRSNAIYTTRFLDDFAGAGEVRIAEDQTRLLGRASYEFEVQHFQAFPLHQTLT